ncbi:MAG: hypothetical protein KAY24_07170 [Candidatus Eisenbacteria sp.]|nr:hypothetical protein [Candidatus Eisenbacteria bacterium]
MKTPALILCLVALPWGAHADCNSAETGIAAYFAVNWQSWGEEHYSGCDPADLINALEVGCNRLEIPDDEEHRLFNIDTELSNTPECTLRRMYAELHHARTVFIETHGLDPLLSPQPGFISDCYASEESRDTAFVSLQALGFESGTMIYTVDKPLEIPNAYCIACFNGGIEQKLAPKINEEFLLGGFYCYSGYTREAWGLSSNSWNTFIGYDHSMDMEWNCHNMDKIIKGLGCQRFPLYWHTTDHAMYGTTALELFGNRENQYRCDMSCWNWAGHFLCACARDGEIQFCYVDEDPGSQYIIRSAGETVAIRPGEGTDGEGRIRCYSVPVAPEYDDFVLVEVDDRGVETPSALFTWDGAPCFWDQIALWHNRPLREYLSQERVPPDPADADHPPGRIPEELNSGRAPEEHVFIDYGTYREIRIGLGDDPGQHGLPATPVCDECAHAIIVGPPGWQWVTPLTIAMYDLVEHFNYKVRFFQLYGGGLWTPREILREVQEANFEFNQMWGTSYPVDPAPLLMLMGDDDLIEIPTFENDELGSCRTADGCYSVNLLTDVNEDGFPDGPHTWIPAAVPQEALDALQNETCWNQGSPWVRQDGRVLCFVDDMYGDEVAGEWMVASSNNVLASYYASGYAVMPLLKHSICPGLVNRRSAGISAINAGIRDLWVIGFGTCNSNWTHFLCDWAGIEDSLTTNQIITVLAPSCETVNQVWPTYNGPELVKRLMFNDLTHTRAVAVIGQLNAGYGEAHAHFQDVLLNEFINAPVGTPYATVCYNATQTIREQYPIYGQGVACFGGQIGTIGAMIAEEPERNDPDPRPMMQLRCASDIGVTRISFWLAERGEVHLNIYDLEGRDIAAVKNGTLKAGRYKYSWFQRDKEGRKVCSGVYFVKLEVKTDNCAKECLAKVHVIR